MSMSELEMLSTEEIINELFKRETFAGVIIYSRNEHRFDGQPHQGMVLKTSVCPESTVIMLEKGLNAMKNQPMEDQS